MQNRNSSGKFVPGSQPHNKGKTKYSFLTKEWFDINYYRTKNSLSQVGREHKINRVALLRRLKILGLTPISKTILQGGKNNPFYGKKHTKETKNKMRGYRESVCGKNNPFWKGGSITYYGPDWRKQQRLTRQRANDKCERCGKKQNNRKLDVHHLTPYRISKNNNLNNLIALCVKCHRNAPEHRI